MAPGATKLNGFGGVETPFPKTLLDAMGPNPPEKFLVPVLLTIYGVRAAKSLVDNLIKHGNSLSQKARLLREKYFTKWQNTSSNEQPSPTGALHGYEPFDLTQFPNLFQRPNTEETKTQEKSPTLDQGQALSMLIDSLNVMMSKTGDFKPKGLLQYPTTPFGLTPENRKFLEKLLACKIDPKIVNEMAQWAPERLAELRAISGTLENNPDQDLAALWKQHFNTNEKPEVKMNKSGDAEISDADNPFRPFPDNK